MRVLLVDPEGDLLPGLQGPLLGVPGVELYCAPDGPTAIQHAGFLGTVDVLLTEVFLQGLDGFALRDNLRASTPSLRTIFLTRHDLGAYADGLQGAHVLRIPVPPEQLLPLLNPPQAARPSAPPPLPPRTLTPKSSPQKPLAPVGAQPPVSTVPAPLETPAPAAPAAPMPPAPSLATTIPLAKPSRPTPAPPSATATVINTAPGEGFQELPPPSPPPPALKEGLVLGPYKLLREDESTSWGPTFTAVHSTLGRPVTLVMLAAHQSADHGVRGEFLEEAGAKAGVQHSAVLTV